MVNILSLTSLLIYILMTVRIVLSLLHQSKVVYLLGTLKILLLLELLGNSGRLTAMEGISLFIVKVNQSFRAAQIYNFHPYSAQNIINLESKWKKSNFTHGTTIGHKSTISPK